MTPHEPGVELARAIKRKEGTLMTRPGHARHAPTGGAPVTRERAARVHPSCAIEGSGAEHEQDGQAVHPGPRGSDQGEE